MVTLLFAATRKDLAACGDVIADYRTGQSEIAIIKASASGTTAEVM